MAKTVTLKNGRHWATQTAALSHFKDLLHRYKNGDIVDRPDDIDDLTALLTVYDEARAADESSKIGDGIQYIKRLNNSVLGWPTDGFWVFRIDGSSVDFSYIAAVKSATSR
ncbi:DCL family protein [Rugamonas rubra]|uniref:DCL family protein n=1 Tax=Rugamonas rubra TaxID=758825 RepID=UPI000B838F61|nr:DCL family protein [Rugamonas rubra]